MKKFQLYAGFLAPLVALAGIGTAAYINRSWWRITENAISDLGRVGLPNNWVLNVSLITTAALAIYYAIGLFTLLRNSAEKAGVTIFIFGLIFLALIGLFPEGTSPHYYVSWAFFVTTSLSLLITGVGMRLSGRRGLATFTVTVFVLGWALGLWAKGHYHGVAVAESIGAATFALWHYMVLFSVARNVQ
ncbi:DUF998 domain-containing protein [Thermococcus sp.]|uniref:DUF998 domain-containing protein n=1 Tax=Thermococcus sp. TaxID=35749 RepID=UPI0025F0E250|nr:DUF998 domain-containing protein [Thermococcus sp.]